MTGRFIRAATAAYKYPLLLKQLWHTPLVQAPDQVIVYRGIKRFSYRLIEENKASIDEVAAANEKAGSKGRGAVWPRYSAITVHKAGKRPPS